MNLQPPAGSPSGLRARARSGFTLVEVMVATVLLSMVILGVLAVLIGSYRVAAKARYNDQARYVIKSFADQFLTQQTTDGSGNILPLFTVTSFAAGSVTGYGLSWTNADGTISTGGTDPSSAPAYVTILLAQNTGATIKADVARSVNYLYPTGANSGYATTVPQNSSAGYMLEATFTITPETQASGGANLARQSINAAAMTITVVRAIP